MVWLEAEVFAQAIDLDILLVCIMTVMSNRFANIFHLTEEQAISLLQTPREELLDDAADRYVAAAQLSNYPSERTIAALIDAVKRDDDDHLDNRIVRRKAMESLGRLKAVEALPVVQTCLSDEDCYLVENAVWATGEIGAADPSVVSEGLLADIAAVLDRPQQTYRVAIHTLAKFDYSPALERIQRFTQSDDEMIKSAAITTVCRFTNNYDQMGEVTALLQHTSLNARRACIQDLVDAQYYEAIPQIACAPVSVAFRLRGIRLLADAGLATGQITFEAIAPALDQVIRDHPQDIQMVHRYAEPPTLDQLINDLYDTDLGRCYLATQMILTQDAQAAAEAVMATLSAKAHQDYGGHYHVMKLLGWLKYAAGYDTLVQDALQNTLPQFLKSRMAGAIALGELGDERCIPHLKDCLTDSYWALRYASLMALAKLEQWDAVAIAAADADVVVAAKAKQLRSHKPDTTQI
ncbi:MAG: HEAT repeat domain-containing protein [Leptolyngbyaceae cyanobacterium]